MITNERRLRLSRLHRLLLLPLLAGVATGCSREVRVPVHPVSGSVTYKGEVPKGATVALHPVGQSFPMGVVVSAKVQPDGTFKTSVYDPEDGAPEGDYVVTVQWNRVITEPEAGTYAGPNVIPKQYATPDTSPIKVSVKSGNNQLDPIKIQ